MLGSSLTKGTAFAHLCVRHWFGCLNWETVMLFLEVRRSEGLSPARLPLAVVGLGQRSPHGLVQNIDMCESMLCLALLKKVLLPLSWPWDVSE